jgi:adenylate cyclase
MGDFFAELKRRHIYRVAAAYAVVTWVLVQVVNNIAPVFDLPPWVARAVVFVLALGFPIVLVFAWVLELKGPNTPAKTGAADWVLAAVAIAFMGMFAYEQLAASRATNATPTGVEAAREAAAKPAGISVAVLPFANMSGDAGQEFFSDGMTEEITSALAKIPDLRVVGRSSAFQFKGQNKDLRTIGQALSATHLLEGSVRKAGTRLRITAELVKADDGLHLWTENYDRELKDVFVVQEDIAQAIAVSLRVPLGLKQGEALVSNRTGDLDSYQQYLRARAQFRARAMDEAVATLEGVVARDRNYAPAWALLPNAYSLAFAYNLVTVRSGSIEEQRRARQNLTDKMEKAAREAIRLDPKQPGGYLGLAAVERDRGHDIAAESLFQQALALDPGDPESLDLYSQWLFRVGRMKDSLRLREQLRVLEPFVPIYNTITGSILHADGQNEAAMRLLEAVPSGGAVGERRNLYLAQTYATAGRYGEAADTLLAIPQDQNRSSRQSVVEAARLLRTAPAKVSAPESLPALQGILTFVYLYVGVPDRVMDEAERALEAGSVGFVDWTPQFSPVRKTDRFKAYVRKTGLVDYWRTKGWPDLCHPTTGDDFECN